MRSFLVHKLMIMIITLFGVSLIAFALPRLAPGDPVLLMIGERGADPAVYQEMRAKLGLDRPILTQYFQYLGQVVQGDFGVSLTSREPVVDEFKARFPATVELGLFALILATLFGIPFGIIAATHRSTKWDYSIMGVSLVGYSMPVFWWGLILIIIFSVMLGWTPVSGRVSVLYDIPTVTGFYLIDAWMSYDPVAAFSSVIRHLILPAVALATIPMAVIARMTRSSLLEVLQEDYIRTAKAKGLPRAQLILKHALKNALIPIITVIGLMVGTLVTGAILTESIFSWPGIGRWLVSSIEALDYPVIQGGILLIAVIVILVNMTVDVLYAWVNPRMRES